MAPGRNHTYVYDPTTNWLTNVTNTVGGASVIGLAYDVQGNLANKNGVVTAFDYGNRLRSTLGLTYRYDAEGRRVRQDSAGAQLKYSHYVKDGRLVWQRDEPAGKRISNVYLAGSLVAEFNRPIGSTTETLTYLHTDPLGSPIAKTNAAGSLIETSEYEPYGKLLNRANDDRMGYTGHVQDAATGFTYMQQRYYDPMIGRFLSVDPVTADSATGANFNRYWYANNNPYKFTDPDGRMICNRSQNFGACEPYMPPNPWNGMPGGSCPFCLGGGNNSNADDSYKSRARAKNSFWDFEDGFEGAIDTYEEGGQAKHEIHVFKDGKEVGLYKDGSFFNKHGKKGVVPNGMSERSLGKLKGIDNHMMVVTGRVKVSAQRAAGLRFNAKAMRGVARFAGLATIALVLSGEMPVSEALGIETMACGSTEPCGGYVPQLEE